MFAIGQVPEQSGHHVQNHHRQHANIQHAAAGTKVLRVLHLVLQRHNLKTSINNPARTQHPRTYHPDGFKRKKHRSKIERKVPIVSYRLPVLQSHLLAEYKVENDGKGDKSEDVGDGGQWGEELEVFDVVDEDQRQEDDHHDDPFIHRAGHVLVQDVFNVFSHKDGVDAANSQLVKQEEGVAYCSARRWKKMKSCVDMPGSKNRITLFYSLYKL